MDRFTEGGLWEAGVKSMKHHLKRAVGDRTLTYEEWATVLAQIEACLQSRPLYPRNNEGISDGPSPRSLLSWSYSLCQQSQVISSLPPRDGGFVSTWMSNFVSSGLRII